MSNVKVTDDLEACFDYFAPPPDFTISQWADAYRFVSQGNAMPGPWRTDSAPYQGGIMDAVSDPNTVQVSAQMAAQTGKSACLENIIGYYISQDPKSMMLMQPTQRDLQTWMEAKLNPLLNDTPSLAERVAKPRARSGVNNQNMKSYPGGYLMFAYSGSSNTMRGRSAPVILCDEIDGYETTEEGDPVNLLWQRAATFGDQRKLVLTSTPTIKGASRIETAFEQGDQRRFHVPCPHCNEFQTLQWSQVKWDKKEGEHLPETAFYVCGECGGIIHDADKLAMLRQGKWVAEKEFKGHASFHLNELYSPWRKFSDIVKSFLEKKASHDLQSFVNVSLAETWEEKSESVDEQSLISRTESYLAPVPQGACFLTAGIDMQMDRLEVEIVGWGVGLESWSVDYRILHGNPMHDDVWYQLDKLLTETFTHESGAMLSISSACIDTGGGEGTTQACYEYIRRSHSGRLFGIKGVSGPNRPLVSAPSRKQSGRNQRPIDLYTVNVDEAKTLIYQQLKITQAGSGFCHFPDFYNEEYFLQLTAEKRFIRYHKGFQRPEWRNVRSNKRNEALDCRVYALAALKIIAPNLAHLHENLNQKETKEDDFRKKTNVLAHVPRHNVFKPRKKTPSWREL